VRFEVLTAEVLRIQVFLHVVLCYYIILVGPCISKDHSAFMVEIRQAQNI